MQGVSRGRRPQASRRFLLKPSVDAFWNYPGGDQVEPPFGSIKLTWPGRANRSSRSFGGRRYRSSARGVALQMQFIRDSCRVLTLQCKTALAPGARQSAVAATDGTINDRLSYHAALPVDANSSASQLLSALPLASCTPASGIWTGLSYRQTPGRLQHAPQTGRRRRTIQAHQGPESTRRDKSPHEHQHCHPGARTDRRLKRPRNYKGKSNRFSR